MAGRAISLHLDTARPAAPRRPRMQLIGTGFAALASAAAFASMLGVYLSVRADLVSGGKAFLPDGASIPLSPGNMSAVTLVMSLVTVQWAVYAAARADRPHTYLALGVTLLFGTAYIVQIVYLYTQWGLPLNGPEATTQAVLLFTITAAHLAMTAGAMLYLALMAIRSLGGQFTGRDAEGLSAAALYWWVTVTLFAVVWYAVYITK